MKKLTLIFIIALGSLSAWAQGTPGDIGQLAGASSSTLPIDVQTTYAVAFSSLNANSVTNSYSLATLSPTNYIAKISMQASMVWTGSLQMVQFYIGNSANTEKYSSILTVTNSGISTPWQYDNIFNVPGKRSTSTNLVLWAIGTTNLYGLTNGTVNIKSYVGVEK